MSLLQHTPARMLFQLIILFFLCTVSALAQSGSLSQADVRRLVHRAEVKFTENRGQIIDDHGKVRHDILFKTSTRDVELYFSRNRVSYIFTRIDGDLDAWLRADCRSGDEHLHVENDHDEHADHDGAPPRITRYRMDMELIGANPMVVVSPEDRTRDFDNYYLGHCTQGITNVRSYRRLVYKNVYPNIDLVINGAQSGAKCDFVVHPGGRVEDIKLRYVAAEDVSITGDGSLRASNVLGYVQEDAPYTYQGIASRQIPSRYVLKDGVIGFEVGSYDRFRPLVIDPVQLWATYYGGTDTEDMNGGDPAEIDRNGNAYITGASASTTFIASPGAFEVTNSRGGTTRSDALLVKFNPDGDRLWGTYFGGSDEELAHGVEVDAEGNVFIAGHTHSPTGSFPVLDAHQPLLAGNRDGFVTKFGAEGNLLWSTYLGGAQFDDAYAFTIDGDGNTAVLLTTQSAGLGTSGTFSPEKPTPPAINAYDLLVTRFTTTGVREWATYYGGSGADYGYGAALDERGNVFITGWTASTNFPVHNAVQGAHGGVIDGFVVKLNNAGGREWATYHGGPGPENSHPGGIGYCDIVTDRNGNAIVTGYSTGGLKVTPGTPAYGGGAGDAYITKFDSNGVITWSTYVGGPGDDYGVGVTTNLNGSIAIIGFTNSVTGFPITFPPEGGQAYQEAFGGGGTDAFIVKFDATGRQIWGTYFGGEAADFGLGIAFDSYGTFLITGFTRSAVPGARPFAVKGPRQAAIHQSQIRDVQDLFLSLFCDDDPPVIDSSGATTFANGDSVILRIASGYRNVRWYRADAPDIVIGTSRSITVTESGEYFVKVESGGGCETISDTIAATELEPSGVGGNVISRGSRIISVAPNPSSSTATIHFELGGSGEVSGTLSDVSGRVVRVIASEHRGRGVHAVTIDTRDLPQGFYLLCMEIGGVRMVERVEVKR